MRYGVRLTADRRALVAFLQRDPIYSAYAIGDLEPEHFSWCTWYVAEQAGEWLALALIYRRLQPSVLLTLGESAGVAAIFDQTPLPQHVYMSALPQHLPVFQARYDFGGDRVRPMVRMSVSSRTFQPSCGVKSASEARDAPLPVLRRLTLADAPAVEALFAEGGAFAPDAFYPAQISEGVFYGLEIGPSGSVDCQPRRLIAVAGTHLVAPAMGVAAVGNVYTHPAQRSRGYGALATSAVTADLLRRGLQVVLNVDQANGAAIHVYQKLGYRIHGPFFEGLAVKREE